MTSSSAQVNTPQPLQAEAVRVRPGRIEVTVRVASRNYLQTNEALVQRCLQHAPTLAQHACRNQVGPLFGAVMYNTSTPHLLEHLVVDTQTRAARNASVVFTGTTQFSSEDPLLANLALSYEDDLVALRALKESLEFLNCALLEQRG